MSSRDDIVRGCIEPGKLYTLRRFCAEMRWKEAALRKARHSGLPIIALGRGRYILGSSAVEFFERLQAEQAQDDNGNGCTPPATPANAAAVPE